jgi:hypothetical protein
MKEVDFIIGLPNRSKMTSRSRQRRLACRSRKLRNVNKVLCHSDGIFTLDLKKGNSVCLLGSGHGQRHQLSGSVFYCMLLHRRYFHIAATSTAIINIPPPRLSPGFHLRTIFCMFLYLVWFSEIDTQHRTPESISHRSLFILLPFLSLVRWRP